MSLKFAVCVLGFAWVFCVSNARAEEPCTIHTTFVELKSERSGDEPSEALVGALLPHVRAELRSRQIGVCADASDARAAMAVIELDVSPAGERVRVTIVDRVTDKSVQRNLDLARLPADSRPLAVAASIDELLRASWLETLVTPKQAAPAPVQTTVRAVTAQLTPPAPPPPPAPVRGELGVDALASIVLGLRSAFGGELQGAYYFGRRVSVLGRVGYSTSLAEATLNGSIQSSLMRFGTGLGVGLLPAHERVGVRAELRLDGGLIWFYGNADERGHVRASDTLQTLTSSLGLRTWLDVVQHRTGSLRAFVGVAAGYALLPAVGTDRNLAGQQLTVAGNRGFSFDATLGCAFAFR